MCPIKIHIEALTLDVIVFGDKVFREVMKWDEFTKLKSESNWMVILIRRGRVPRGVCISDSIIESLSSRWKGHLRIKQEGGLRKPGRELSPETTLTAPWSWTSSFQNCENINFCCWHHSVCGTFLWQPYQTHTLYFKSLVQLCVINLSSLEGLSVFPNASWPSTQTENNDKDNEGYLFGGIWGIHIYSLTSVTGL